MSTRIELSGRVFGKYTVIGFIGKRVNSSSIWWLCRCSCGKEKPVDGGALRNGSATQCRDCAAKERGLKKRKPIEYRKKKQQEYVVKSRFNLSAEEHIELLKKQNHRCLICNSVLSSRPAIDHDKKCCPTNGHSCGKCIRGILCMQCNVGLGNFKDDIRLLFQAMLYLLEKSKHA